MLKDRLLLGPVFILGILGVAWLDNEFAATGGPLPVGFIIGAILAAACAAAAIETTRLLRSAGVAADPAAAACAALLGVVTMALPEQWRCPLVSAACAAAVLVGLGGVAVTKRTHGAAARCAGAAVGFTLLGLMPGALLAVRIEHGVWTTAAVVLVVKACDIGAFATGKAVGRHKLIRWLSPGKTWEGLLGGIVTSAAVGAWLLRTDDGNHSWAAAAAIGAVLGGIGQVGDLAASMLKRDAGAKNSGTLPGFGGALDLLDSILLAAPAAYTALWLLRG